VSKRKDSAYRSGRDQPAEICRHASTAERCSGLGAEFSWALRRIPLAAGVLGPSNTFKDVRK
jgi:hypothetical protein